MPEPIVRAWAKFDVFGKAKMEAKADKANSLSKATALLKSISRTGARISCLCAAF